MFPWPNHIDEAFMVKLVLSITCLMLTACTYSITQVHTEGQGSGDVQEAQTNTPDVSPQISIPSAAL